MLLLMYFLGLITGPVLYGLYILFVIAFEGGYGSTRCEICGFEVHGARFPMWLKYRWHEVVLANQKGHKQGLREWRIRVGRDPDTGKYEDE